MEKTASEQIRELMESPAAADLTRLDLIAIDQVMRSQREKHGAEATGWWFESMRTRLLGDIDGESAA